MLRPGAIGYYRSEAVARRQRINLSWLIRLRWGAAIGQTAVIAVVRWGVHVPLQLLPLLSVLVVTLITNLAVSAWASRAPLVREGLLASLLALDILLLTVLLYFTGGPANPFNFLYLVHIALGAVILRAEWMWALAALACTCFGALLTHHLPLPVTSAFYRHRLPPLQQQGMAVAFGLAAIFIVYFLHRLTAALRASELELAAAREVTARNERLSSLATLAAGAAHELSTPLATIAVVAKELERQLAKSGEHTAIEDARLIRNEVERCRDVLTQMATDAGADAGESFVAMRLNQVVQAALEAWRWRERIQLRLEPEATHATFLLPARSFTQALRGILKNAIDASHPDTPITVHVRLLGARHCIQVIDRGHGMDDTTLTHAGEPFFTTKGPGSGMGLGLFLARTLLERLGGDLNISSIQNEGSIVTLMMPQQESAA